MLQLNLPTLGHWRLQGKAKRIAAGVIGRGNSLALVDYSGGSKADAFHVPSALLRQQGESPLL